MDDRRKSDELGSAPTTPGPSPLPHAPTLAAGSANAGATLDMPADEQGDASGDPAFGSSIGHFIVRARLGAGGMGVVFACEDANLGRRVAIKLLRAKDEHPAFRARMMREAQAMARLEHPNVVRVYEVGTDRGRLFVAMELVDGVTLGTWLREPREWRAIVAMFVQIGEGLAAVHRGGLVHRDFKPENVLVDRTGLARVADFGLARLELADAAPLTQTGAVMGTPGYMAPEQQFGADVDARADQYSYCVALREALGGRPLDETRWQLVPRAIRAAVTRGLSYDASERFASIDELLVVLRAGEDARRPAWPIALAVLAILGTAAGIVAIASSRPSTRTADVVPPRAPLVIAVDAAIAELPAVVDAAIVAVVPRDAAVAIVHPRARDAGVVVAVKPPAPVDVVAASGLPENAGLNIVSPTTQHKPEARIDNPGHLPILRRAIRDLGYDGIDLGAVDRDPAAAAAKVQEELDAATGDDAGIAQVKLGMIARRRGDCKAAQDLFRKSGKTLEPTSPPPAREWEARGSLGFALCDLANGDGGDARSVAMKAWQLANKDEFKIVMGMANYEYGDKEDALPFMLEVRHSKDPRVLAAFKLWSEGFGLGFTGQ